MLYSFKIATRYLTANRAQSLLLVLGVAVGVYVFVFMSALIGGLAVLLIDRTVGSIAHVVVEPADPVEPAARRADAAAGPGRRSTRRKDQTMTRNPTPARRRRNFRRRLALAGLAAWLALAGGCSTTLWPKPPQEPALYALGVAAPASPSAGAPRASAVSKTTLLVNPPRAAAGFETRHIVYLREPNRIEYFAYSQWVDTPAQMLAPLIVRAIERSGAFDAVLLAPSAAAGQWRLDTEVIRLQQDFGASPSQVRFTLRAVLLDSATRRVVAVRELDASVPAATDDTAGGVAAANAAVQRVLGELAAFVANAVPAS